MARKKPEEELNAIIDAVRARGSATVQEIARALGGEVAQRTLQHRLGSLVADKRLTREGKGRATVYQLPPKEAAGVAAGGATAEARGEAVLPLSKEAREIQKYVRQPQAARKPVGYDRAFLDGYRPNESAYLSPAEREHLQKVGTPKVAVDVAGTYARQIMNRLLIDLSWNSSRLEGNTYSLIDTQRLIAFGEEAEGKEKIDAQMILNHKDAIEFLVGSAEEIGFNRYTILNLHALLANNLLADPSAAGRLRNIEVGIGGSVYEPLAVPQLIEECFDQILATAAAIEDPFEQAFFFMVQAPYLQPFDDVNKRVARLGANIPLIKANLTPLTFMDVNTKTYTEAMLGVYELNKTDLIKDVFIWAYERSAARYAAARQVLGEPDPFRLRHRAALTDIIGQIMRGAMNKKKALAHIRAWTQENIEASEREQFREMAENELLGLHEGNFARYRVSPAEFRTWRDAWV